MSLCVSRLKRYGILADTRLYLVAVEGKGEATTIMREYECGFVPEASQAKELAENILGLYYDPALDFDRPWQVAAYVELLSQVTRQ